MRVSEAAAGAPVALLGAVHETACLLRRLGRPIALVSDPDPEAARWTRELPVFADDADARAEAARLDCGEAVVAIDDPRVRRRVMDAWSEAGFRFPSILGAAPDAGGSVDEGCLVQDSAVVSCDVTLGRGARINVRAVVMHDCVLAPFATIAPNATLLGAVEIGEGAYIGAGAVVLPKRRVGAGAIVGAGATVTRDVPDNATVVGPKAMERTR